MQNEMKRNRTPGGFTVTAHSGCMGFSDNSIEAMEAGVRAGAQIVEFDLRYSADGKPVLSHDAPAGACVPLSAAFGFLREHPDVKANVDVKSTEYLETLLPLAQETGVLPQIFLTGVFAQDVPAVREKCPGVPYYLNADIRLRTDVEQLADEAKKLGAVGLNVNHKALTEKLVCACRKRGLLVSVWTVNRTHRAKRVLALQPDNVTTRRPDMVIRLIPYYAPQTAHKKL